MKTFAAVFFALMLVGCAGGTRNAPVATIYDFGMPSTRLAAAGAWSKLALDIKAPQWFDSPTIEYRLLYDDPLKLREYVGSRWAGTPALMLGQRLRQQFAMQGATSNTAVDCLLRIELQEFSHVFDTPQRSRGLLLGNLSLLGGKRQQLATRQIVIEQPAATPDARGGVAALVAASDELGKQITGWLNELPSAAVCRTGEQQK